MDYKSTYETILSQLKNTKKDEKRKVCKDCGEFGHKNKLSNECPIKIYENDIFRNKIINHVLSLDCSKEINDELLEELSSSLNISMNLCKKLYSDIPAQELLERKMDIQSYITNMNKTECYECNIPLYDIQKKTNKTWKGETVCDGCWCNHSEERDEIWDEIKTYRSMRCCICTKRQNNKGERFHYDHLNMFEKGDSICCMVNNGDKICDICQEIDKCQVVCLSCHHLITDIERKFGFTRIKTSLTKKMNNEELTQEEYKDNVDYYQNIYKEKMEPIYNKLKLYMSGEKQI
jgi:hypothetical protein